MNKQPFALKNALNRYIDSTQEVINEKIELGDSSYKVDMYYLKILQELKDICIDRNKF